MSTLAELGQRLDDIVLGAPTDREELLAAGETVLEHWVRAKALEPTNDTREGFRLLGLHRQGAVGDPSFNAVRETCRELVYHYNLLADDAPQPDNSAATMTMMALVTNHLYLFVTGKLEEQQLGDFCCSSKPIRQRTNNELVTENNDA